MTLMRRSELLLLLGLLFKSAKLMTRLIICHYGILIVVLYLLRSLSHVELLIL
jgi:hypothetical protein